MTPLQENYSDELPTPENCLEDPWIEGSVQKEAIPGRRANHQKGMFCLQEVRVKDARKRPY